MEKFSCQTEHPFPVHSLTTPDVIAMPQQEETKLRKSGNGKRYLGVRQRPSGRWVAEIKDSSQKLRVWLGTYDREEDAAMAYDNAAWLLRGKNAKTNFPYSEILKTHERYCNLVGKNPRFCQLLRNSIQRKNQYQKTSSLNAEQLRAKQPLGSVEFDSSVEETVVCSSSSDEIVGQCEFSFGGCKVYSSVIVAPSFSILSGKDV